MQNPLNWLKEYFQGVVSETRKVVWPGLPTLSRHLSSVIAGLVIFTAFVAGVDYVFIHALSFLVTK